MTLEKLERLHGVEVARSILRDAFGLELIVVDAAGPAAHQRDGVTPSSSEACRVSLFSREGFARCDAFYRELGGSDLPETRACHLGLAAVSVPAVIGESRVHVVASGFTSNVLSGCPPVDRAVLAEKLRALDPNLLDPGSPARSLPVVRGDRVELVRAILRAAAREIEADAEDRRRRISERGSVPGFWGLIGASPKMREVFEVLPRLGQSDATVLIEGESGTGKELVARALHEHGRRRGRPYVAQNCAALPDDLLESTLFGHVKGAFSGAARANIGLFGAADTGTLFLDEVGDMSPGLQVKLLRVLQEGAYLPVGGVQPRTVDVRVVAATHRNLREMVARGDFRQDLFYRLNVLPVRLPPLRDRPGDLQLLVKLFLAQQTEAPTRVSDAAWRCLERYRWPGNVRELRSEVERWHVTAQGAREVGPEHVSAPIREAGGYAGDDAGRAAAAAAAGTGSLDGAVEALERAIIQRGLERTQGNRTQLAKELGISRTTLGQRLRRYGLE